MILIKNKNLKIELKKKFTYPNLDFSFHNSNTKLKFLTKEKLLLNQNCTIKIGISALHHHF